MPEFKTNPDLRFVCSLCGHGQPGLGECPIHKGEVLLDSVDSNVIDYLRRIDEKSLRKRVTLRVVGFILITGIGSTVLFFATLYYLGNHETLAVYPEREWHEVLLHVFLLAYFSLVFWLLAYIRRSTIRDYEPVFDPWTHESKRAPSDADFEDAKKWREGETGGNEGSGSLRQLDK